jgi:hypothetical protein
MNGALSSAEMPADVPAELLGYAATVNVMGKPVQWMTLQELRDELDRTRPAWEAEVGELGVLTDGQLPALGEEARRHQLVAHELLRRPNNG